MKPISFVLAFCLCQFSLICLGKSVTATVEIEDGSYTFTSDEGKKLKVSAYGDDIIRLQFTDSEHPFYSDDHYEMVESHEWRTELQLNSTQNYWQLSPLKNRDLVVQLCKQTLQATFIDNGVTTLSEMESAYKRGTVTKTKFKLQSDEHFTGLGHGFYGREQTLDLQGQRTGRNYGKEPIEQAPLIVPFYLSSKGYGLFLNSSFTNEFSFGHQGEYSIAIDDHGYLGQMDYFYISGGKLTKVLDNYTQLTGRPRLPTKSMLGLQLSDKGHDHDSSTPSDETWWKSKVTEHRNAGYPLDHLVNDNRWRAAGGKRCESKLAWDETRYPAPKSYQQWIEDNGLVMTLDFNRCIARKSDGWKKSFNLPSIENIQFPNSAPDLTNSEFREWFWQIFYDKSLNPLKGFPGDALWIDEFDEQGGLPKDVILSNGRSSAEMRNYWFFLIAKALVQDGWDKSEIAQRPFVWVRGMTAGAQRYATLWSGDIYPNDAEMKGQIRAMQLAGLSGFPFWGHDAGGFYDWKNNLGPNEDLYQRWALGFGSFSPIWKPHGMGHSRWPLDRSEASQKAFHHFAKMRYELMPYTYTMAHKASSSGMPLARAMLLDHQDEDEAWQFDLQYMWGDSLLVAPQTDKSSTMNIWLPKGQWYAYGENQITQGDRVIEVTPKVNQLPIYVKSGAIIPKRLFAKSTKFIDKSILIVDLYLGKTSSITLIEDDDRTNAYKADNQQRITQIQYTNEKNQLRIGQANGTFTGAPQHRTITLRILGSKDVTAVTVNGKTSPFTIGDGILNIELGKRPIDEELVVSFN